MAKYIDKDAIVAEIKRLIEIANNNYAKFLGNRSAWAQQRNVCEKLLSYIDTLEVKDINNVWNNASDFPKAEAGRSILLVEDNGRTELLKSPSAEKLFYFRPENLKMWAYVDELLPITTHFNTKE